MKNIETHNQTDALTTELKNHSERKVGQDLSPLTKQLQLVFKDKIDLIVLYGSCLRSNNFTEGILDFYVIVDNYHEAYNSPFFALLNKALPPNVFYIESNTGNETLRAKYAVISMEDFYKATNKWFHPYVWARFAQPVRLIYAKNDNLRRGFYQCLTNSVIRYIKESLPLLHEGEVTSEKIWTNALELSYSAELRPERSGRCNEIVKQSLNDLSKLIDLALPAFDCLKPTSKTNTYLFSCNSKQKNNYRHRWLARRWQGKILSILRLMKAVLTFHDCVEYAAWKINRHSGIEIEITPALKKFPILLGFKVLWQLLRRGAIR